jgi:hypothetical protein
MALLTHYSCFTDQTSSSPSSDSIATIRKMAFEKACKNLSVTNERIKSYGYFDPLLKSCQTYLLVTEYRFLCNPKGNGLQQLV